MPRSSPPLVCSPHPAILSNLFGVVWPSTQTEVPLPQLTYERKLELMAMEQSARSTEEYKCDQGPGKGQKRRAKRRESLIPFIRWGISLCLCSQWILDSTWYSARERGGPPTEDCFQGQGHGRRDLSGDYTGSLRARTTQGATTTSELHEKASDTDLQKGEVDQGQRSQYDEVSAGHQKARRSREATSSPRDRPFGTRTTRTSRAVAEGQRWQGDGRRGTHGRPRGDPRRWRCGEAATQGASTQSRSCKCGYATTATAVSKPDDGFHAGTADPITECCASGFGVFTRSSCENTSHQARRSHRSSQKRDKKGSTSTLWSTPIHTKIKNTFGHLHTIAWKTGRWWKKPWPRQVGRHGQLREASMQRRLQDALNGQLGQLARLLGLWTSTFICGDGLVMSPKWMKFLVHCRTLYEMNRPLAWELLDVSYGMCRFARNITSILLGSLTLGCLLRPSTTSIRSTTKGLLPKRSYWICCLWFFLMILPMAAASEDEHIRQALRTRNQADALQPDLTYNSRWQWVRQNAGFIQPVRNQDYSATIHRPDAIPMPSPTGVRMQFQHPTDPMHYIIGVERFWNDLGPIYGQGMTWTVRLMPQVQPSNSLLNPDRWYYMLTSHIEDNRRPSEVPIYFEVEWVTPQTRHRGYTKPWTPRQITVVRFLQIHGLLAQCTTTHRCEITLDGRAQRNTYMTLRKASYLRLLAKPIPAPIDSEDESHEPFPMMQSLRERTSSTDTTSSDTQNENDHAEDTSASESIAGHNSYVTAIFRPGHGLGRPPFMHSTHSATSRRWIEDVYVTWPRLRYVTWHHHDVHQTYTQDFPQLDSVDHKVLVTLQDLQSALHQVAFVVGTMMDITVVQAWPYPPRISAFIVLYELGLWEMCATHVNDCKVSVNGLPLDLQDQRLLRHGDYILIRIAPSRGPDGRARLRQAFGILEDFEGLEYTTETGIARISGDGLRAQRSTDTPYHVPQTRRHAPLHEDYWLCMGFFVWCGAFAILSMQIRREPRLPRPARQVGGQRFGLTEPRKPVRAPWMLIWLVISQPVLTAVEGLQLPPQGDFDIEQPCRYVADDFSNIQSESWRPTGCLVQLTPPGNPEYTTEDHHIV